MGTRHPLSYIQKLLLSEQSIDPIHLNIGGYLLVQGKLDPSIYSQAVSIVFKENEILSSRVVSNSEAEYFLELIDFCEEQLIMKDFSNREDADDMCKEWIQQRLTIPLEITEGKMYELGYLLAGERSYCYHVYHHLISDGWSMALIGRRIAEVYNSLVLGQPVSPGAFIPYFQFVEDSKKYFLSDKHKKDQNYWAYLAKNLDGYDCNLSNKKRTKKVTEATSKSTVFDYEYYAEIIKFSQRNNISVFHFFITVFLCLVKARTGNDKVLINVRLQNRLTKEQKLVLGPFSNIMPVALDFGDDNLSIVFKNLKRNLKENYRHQRCSLQEFYPASIAEGNDFSNAMVLSYEPHRHDYKMGGFSTEAFSLSKSKVADSIEVYIREFHHENRVFVYLYFDKFLFSDLEADIFIEQVRLVIDQILFAGVKSFSQVKTVTKLEQSIFDKLNDTEAILLKDNLCSVLEDVLYGNPLCSAVICKGKAFTYRELLKEAKKVAGYLQSIEVMPGDKVAVMMDYSFEMIVAITGIFMCGAVLVPISNKDPVQRAGKIICDSKAKLLVTDNNCELLCPQINIQDMLKTNKRFFSEQAMVKEDAPVYIVYTSGSTGEPKGAINTHKAVVNVLEEWKYKHKIVGERFVLLQTSSFAHDVFIGNYLKTIATGGTLVLPTEEERYDLGKLTSLFQTNKVNVLDSTPSLIVMIVDYIEKHVIDDSSLKLIIVGSDVCSLQDFKRLNAKYAGKAKVVNSYGVSEAAIYSSEYTAEAVAGIPAEGTLPIGKPFRNTKMYVLDDNFKQVNIGREGELFLGGYGLASGYTSEVLTDEKFMVLSKMGRVYRTGDLARVLSDGNIQFIGRKDFQIKMRGYRIEPGEIEAVLEKYPYLENAVVVSAMVGDNKVLVVYYTASKLFDLNDLLLHLRASLPGYMVPGVFQKIDEFPLSAAGKIDRKKLMEMPIKTREVACHEINQEDSKDKVAKVWKDVLGKRFIQNISFAEMGADSLEAIRIASELNVLGYKCSYLDIYSSLSFEDFFSTFVSEDKVEDIDRANLLLIKVFGEGVKLKQIHHQRLSKRLVELAISAEKKFVDVTEVLKFCKNRLDSNILPQYVTNREYVSIDHIIAKNILSDLSLQEMQFFKTLISGGSEYRIKDPLYSDNFRDYYRNVYFCSYLLLDESKAQEAGKALPEVMNKNDLLRATLIKTGADGYQWEVFKTFNPEVPFIDLSGYEAYSSYDFVYNVLSEYYAKQNEFRKFMFRVVLIKMNLKEVYLWYFMDDSIHDDYGNQLIDRYMKNVIKQGYADYPTTKSYHSYLSNFFGNRQEIKEKEVKQILALDDFEKVSKEYGSFIKNKIKDKSGKDTFRYRFKISEKLNDDFRTTIEAFLIFAKFHFPFVKIPVCLLHNTRFYSPKEYGKSIGAFIDEVPLILDTSITVEENITSIKKKLEYINQEGIHFKNILLNPSMRRMSIRKQAENVVGDLKKTNKLLLLNMKQGDIRIEELVGEQPVVMNRWLHGVSFNIITLDGFCEILIRSPYKLEEDALKELYNKSFR